MEATGTRLVIDTSCAEAVTIQPNPSLTGRAIVDATAEHPDELAQLAFDSGQAARLRVPADRCWRPEPEGSFSPTLNIAVQVPASFDIAISEGGGATYKSAMLAAHSRLTSAVASGCDPAASPRSQRISAAAARPKIASVDGTVKAEISGGGGIDIGHGTAPVLTLDLSGGGTFTLGDGTVDKLAVNMSGGGQAHIGATVQDASLEVSGGGSVSVAKVTGSLSKDVSGAGSVTVGGR